MDAMPNALVELIHIHEGLKVLSGIRQQQGARAFLRRGRHDEITRNLENCGRKCGNCRWATDCVKRFDRITGYLEAVS